MNKEFLKLWFTNTLKVAAAGLFFPVFLAVISAVMFLPYIFANIFLFDHIVSRPEDFPQWVNLITVCWMLIVLVSSLGYLVAHEKLEGEYD